MHASTSAQRKPSRQSHRLSSMRSARSGKSDHGTARQPGQYLDQQDSAQENSQHRASTTASVHSQPKWWHVHLFRGMINDVKRRAPYYWSDWTDAWDYRVVPATVYMYFANILPALAFSLDMFEKTRQSYGVNEVLLASVLGAIVFSLFAAQPLVIVGVTGPITVFNYTVYDIIAPRGTPYLAFMCWIGIWSLIMHWILAITNSCNALTYVTRFSCDIFGFYVACIYIQKGIQVLTRQWGSVGETSAYLSIMVALLVLMCAWICGELGNSNLFKRPVRKFLEDYGTPLTIIFFTGFVYIGQMRDVDIATLPTSKAFFPTTARSWLVHFWDISVGDIFLAIPFAILLTILFYFDHNDHVVEQRVSNFAQGLLTLGTMTGPLLIVLHLIPQGVMAGLFFIMGVQALQGNGITQKLIFLAEDKNFTSASNPLKRIERRSAIWVFVALELFGFGATFAITQTIAAIGFPVIILLLIPVRSFLLPKWFSREELAALDGPTASPFTMESVGGTHGMEDYDEAVSSGARDEYSNRGDGVLRNRISASPESAVEEDDLERGEAYELPSLVSRRRSTASRVD
ncbi:hypothetical protein N7537_001279 [Penicillium hordei]|uniref:Bicarbonate transporter-like transmembrane domain-containing protein n=1 Tax=Penicillium hordei TaxID=40994 RepID=A0AAD6EGD3_9EURO|nr:uncharacterized protein N7537_001279 [Penicillium hordei]KAJ5616165.1 hypothetical protein N7537_001279 [Penicillium hordei]